MSFEYKNRRKLNVAQAADYIGCCRSYVYRLFNEGKIEGYRIGSRQGTKFFLDSVDAYLERCIE